MQSGKHRIPRREQPMNKPFTVVHFNARSISCKFHEIMAELTVYDLLADAIFITETWLTSCSSLTLFNVPGYTSFHFVRNNSRGGGTLIFIRNEFASTHIFIVVTCNNSYNVCAVSIHLGARKI